MDARDGQAQLDSMGVKLIETGQELADAAFSHEDASVGDLVEFKSKFQCPNCNKSYTTKKSLQRHLSSTSNACAKERLTQEQITAQSFMFRLACSRCGKDCATNPSIERHISKSCWRSCDECAADGIIRCDSVTKTGPCRTCEGKGCSCTKHTSAIPGTKAVRWTGAANRPQLKSTAEDEDMSPSDQKPAKRKSVASPNASSERAHKKKRAATTNQQDVDYGCDRMHDPLGGPACIPPKAKKAAVTDWLDGQANNSASAALACAQVQDDPLRTNHAGWMQNLHHNHQQPDRFHHPTHTSGGALPSSAPFLSSQRDHERSTPNDQPHLPFLSTFRNHHAVNYRPAASTVLTNLPHPPVYSGLPSMTVDRPIQFDHMYFQMQTLRQQNQAHDLEMARGNGFRNGTTLHTAPPPFDASGPLKYDGQGFVQAQGSRSMPSFQAPIPNYHGLGNSVLVLRIHSNTYDRNGETIFSILRMRASETFGPRLDAYCANRGKEYGVDWMFVYHYHTGTSQNPGHDMQIALTWDMTPADVKVDDLPGVAMRNMDTIYVMKAKAPASANIKQKMSEGGAVQSSGPQISHQIVDMTNGETTFYQNPDVTRQWSQAVQKDNAYLRASRHQIQSVITQLKQELFAKNKLNTELDAHIAELTKTSKKYRESIQRRLGDPTTSDSDPPVAQFSLSRPPAGRVARQRPGLPIPPVQQRPLRHSLPQQYEQQAEQQIKQQTTQQAGYYKQHAAQQAAQQRSNPGRNDFVKKCEAVRDPDEQVSQQLQPLQFPSFESGSTVPDCTHELNMNFAFGDQVQSHDRFYDAAEKVAAESGVEGMEEE